MPDKSRRGGLELPLMKCHVVREIPKRLGESALVVRPARRRHISPCTLVLHDSGQECVPMGEPGQRRSRNDQAVELRRFRSTERISEIEHGPKSAIDSDPFRPIVAIIRIQLLRDPACNSDGAVAVKSREAKFENLTGCLRQCAQERETRLPPPGFDLSDRRLRHIGQAGQGPLRQIPAPSQSPHKITGQPFSFHGHMILDHVSHRGPTRRGTGSPATQLRRTRTSRRHEATDDDLDAARIRSPCRARSS